MASHSCFLQSIPHAAISEKTLQQTLQALQSKILDPTSKISNGESYCKVHKSNKRLIRHFCLTGGVTTRGNNNLHLEIGRGLHPIQVTHHHDLPQTDIQFYEQLFIAVCPNDNQACDGNNEFWLAKITCICLAQLLVEWWAEQYEKGMGHLCVVDSDYPRWDYIWPEAVLQSFPTFEEAGYSLSQHQKQHLNYQVQCHRA